MEFNFKFPGPDWRVIAILTAAVLAVLFTLTGHSAPFYAFVLDAVRAVKG
jgi:hypothetical protein